MNEPPIKRIKYPAPILKDACFGITAPSSGVPEKLHPRLNIVLADLERRGFKYVEGKCLRGDRKNVSGTAEERAEDFLDLYLDTSIAAIMPPWGGELLINILGYIDFDLISKSTPKWVIGYSDTSTLLFPLTIRASLATIHGLNLMDSILKQSDRLTQQTFDVMAVSPGGSITQNSSEKYQLTFTDFEKDPEAIFNLTQQTEWKSLDSHNHTFSGRIIGGCLDTLRNLIGTPYGDLPIFLQYFSDDGVILYLENSGDAPSDVCRALWNMRYAGWFNGIKDIVFGRSAARETEDHDGVTYRDALDDVFKDLPFPVIYDADIGHKPPQMTIINGSVATIEFFNGTGKLTQLLKP